MKVAIVHEWLTNMGGSERVISVFHEIFPEAPIYTTLFEPEKIDLPLRNADIRTSFLQRLPKPLRKHQRLLPFMPYAFEQFDLSEYDLVISSSHACAKGVLTRADALHVCYCYTPMRYAWDMYHDYIAPLKGLKRWFAIWQLHEIRIWDQTNAQRVDRFISISQSVAKRIKKHYSADSKVIAPPVNVARFRYMDDREDYYLVVSRLVGYKRVDIAIEACIRLKRKLLVIGIGEEEKRLKALCEGKENWINFLDWQSEEQVVDYLAKAKAFLFPGEEDFGLTMVEALASGCPVIAYGRGGALDILRDEETGILFEEQTVGGMVSAIERFEQLSGQNKMHSPDLLRKNAEKFSIENFKEKFLEVLDCYNME
ncbi:glycosyltransferase [Desulfitobacterium sp. PCE1]|uniref:glycosyltransferase n=1 Tax=Desulfitobacterium sp. PCE1 TaxID=146907 RepID=UPI00036BE90D|nr:glycosyltransferase [Desulfitobacterium sp. PCE1]